MALALEQANEYLASSGITLPSFVVGALLDQVNSIQACLNANYSEGTALLIQTYLLGLLALSQGDQYISSQTAPSGASRSFRYREFTSRWRSLVSLIKNLDTEGCADSLIPDDPSDTKRGGLWVAKGGCHCE